MNFFWLKIGYLWNFKYIVLTSKSKKPGQIPVVYHYCDLSRFFWLRHYSTTKKSCDSNNLVLSDLQSRNSIYRTHIWHFSYICDYKGSWWTKTKKTHFSQNRVTSESKKTRQIAVVIYYCDLSRFFWLRRYLNKPYVSNNLNLIH